MNSRLQFTVMQDGLSVVAGKGWWQPAATHPASYQEAVCPDRFSRHCEERSDAAVQSRQVPPWRSWTAIP